jgi:hypothetical protein
METNTLWFEVAIVCGMFAFGNIFFGHFEEHTPKLRRVLKLILFNIVVLMLSKYLGRAWSFGFLGICLLAIVYVHSIVLPRKGIHGLTGEPKEKYYKLRGWEKFLNKQDKEIND